MKGIHILLFSLILLFAYSCKKAGTDKIAYLVNEWKDKEIIYPNHTYFTVLGKDTIYAFFTHNNKHSIVTYIDSVGCTSCKLQLRKWKLFILELDSLTNSTVPVYFFLYSKNKREIINILKHEQFNYPVCIAEDDSLNILNHFSEDISFQTFLLDKDNKVIAVGNPVLNPKIKDLYFNIILNKSSLKEVEQVSMTKVAISEQMINMGNFSWKDNQEEEVTIKNVGHSPLVIDEILTSCGCLAIEYDKKTVLPKDSTCIRIRYQAEQPEHFNKTITVYCNAEDSPFHLKISGNAK